MLVVNRMMPPGMIQSDASNRPLTVFGEMSPYPTVVTVVM